MSNMQLSELISCLQEILEEYGDSEVVDKDGNAITEVYDGAGVESVVIEFEGEP